MEFFKGQYCLPGIGETPCPVGTYNPYTGGSSVSSCFTCPGGFICATQGISSLT